MSFTADSLLRVWGVAPSCGGSVGGVGIIPSAAACRCGCHAVGWWSFQSGKANLDLCQACQVFGTGTVTPAIGFGDKFKLTRYFSYFVWWGRTAWRVRDKGKVWGGEGGETARIRILFIYFMPLTVIKWITRWGKSTGKQQSEHLARGNHDNWKN